MLDVLRDVPVAQMATVVCMVFVGITWLGAIFIRPFLRLLVRPQADLNTLLGNFVSMYGVFYGILMGLLAVAAYQNKADVKQAIISEATSLAALFRNVSAYPEAVRAPLQETTRDYTQFVIDSEWPSMRQGEHTQAGIPLINKLQEQLSAYEPATSGSVHPAPGNHATVLPFLRAARRPAPQCNHRYSGHHVVRGGARRAGQYFPGVAIQHVADCPVVPGRPDVVFHCYYDQPDPGA